MGRGNDFDADEFGEHRVALGVGFRGVAGKGVNAPIFAAGKATLPGPFANEFLFQFVDDGPALGAELLKPLGDFLEGKIIRVAVAVLFAGVNLFGEVDVVSFHRGGFLGGWLLSFLFYDAKLQIFFESAKLFSLFFKKIFKVPSARCRKTGRWPCRSS